MNTAGFRVRGIVLAALLGAALVGPGVALADEADGREQRDSIRITSDTQFDFAHGVRAGSGTARDPYVISGWSLKQLELKDTSAHVIITDNTIQGTLILDWAGPGLHVHNNDIGNLLVNRNVDRKGAATSGHISHNEIRVVGQLRHYDGVFSHNVVGADYRSMFGPVLSHRAVNFDGFNGARFTDNVIYGYMDARLHGHHHSSGFAAGSHHHSGHHDHGEAIDHSQRYHQVLIANNRIHSDHRYALAYVDTAHSANDRTAASETDSALNQPHVHYTRVKIVGNDLTGAGIWVNVFNASDRLHSATATGSLGIKDNDIELAPSSDQPLLGTWSNRNGIHIYEARDVNVGIVGNSITGPSEEPSDFARGYLFDFPGGVSLHRIDKANVKIYDTEVRNVYYGVKAYDMTPTVQWTIRNLDTRGVAQPVYHRDTPPPRQRP